MAGRLILLISLLISLPVLAEEKRSQDELVLECTRRAKIRAQIAYDDDPFLAAKYEVSEQDKCYRKYNITFQE